MVIRCGYKLFLKKNETKNRCRFNIEVARAVATAIGKGRTAIRLSQYGVANDIPHYPEIEATYNYLSQELNKPGITYIPVVDHPAMGAPPVAVEIRQLIRKNFKDIIILAGGYDKESAERDIASGLCNLVAFDRPFMNNPDMVESFEKDQPLSKELHADLFYTADAKGYTDYPFYE